MRSGMYYTASAASAPLGISFGRVRWLMRDCRVTYHECRTAYGSPLKLIPGLALRKMRDHLAGLPFFLLAPLYRV